MPVLADVGPDVHDHVDPVGSEELHPSSEDGPPTRVSNDVDAEPLQEAMDALACGQVRLEGRGADDGDRSLPFIWTERREVDNERDRRVWPQTSYPLAMTSPAGVTERHEIGSTRESVTHASGGMIDGPFDR